MANLWHPGSVLPENHQPITPHDVNQLARPMVIYALTAGTVTIVSEDGVAVTYTVPANWTSPIFTTRVMATGTTASVVGLY